MIGKFVMGCSALFILCTCLSFSNLVLSNAISEPTPNPLAQNDLTAIYATAQTLAWENVTQTALAFSPVPSAATSTTFAPTEMLTPTATLEPAVSLPASVAACVPTGTTHKEGLVVGIVDGNTINVAIGEQTVQVRYIGIDTPQEDEPYYWLAIAENQNLVYAKQITLVKDIVVNDQLGQLLRYVFVGDTFVNLDLIEKGYAHATTYSSGACADYFAEAQSQAKGELVGIWAPPTKAVIYSTPTMSFFAMPSSSNPQSGSNSYSGSNSGSGSDWQSGSTSGGCCKVCTTGKACGDSCISRNYTCRQPPGCACD